MTGAEITADWAWISKDLSAGIGYSVLKVSTDAIDFGAISSGYEPGAPKSTAAPDAIDAPPWVTYGPGDGGRDGVLIAVSVRDPWTQRDHTGRPVWPQRLLVMRYAELAAAAASFQTIWAAVRGAPVPASDGAPLRLSVDGQPAAGLIPVIEANFDSLAVIAAALLEGSVAVGDASHLPREQRLELLDAVAALLPYGYRADLSASAFVNNTVKHEIRLVFADFAKADQQVVSLLAPRFLPRGEVGGRYLAALHEKRNKNGTATLVRHLWGVRWEGGQRPCSFLRPEFALAVLEDLDFLGSIREALSKQLVPPELIRKFFAARESARVWDQFDVPQRDNAVRSLAGSGETAAAVLVGRWQSIGDDVIDCANRDLDAGRVDLAAWCLNSLGQSDGRLADRALANLLVPEDVQPGARDRRSAMLIELLRQRSVPSPGEYPYTCDYLRYGDAAGWQALLVRDLLAYELSAATPGERALGWVGWLCRSPFSGASKWERPEWVNALDFPDSGADPGGAVLAMQALIHGDQRAIPRGNCWTAVFLQASRRTGRLPELLEAVNSPLTGLAAVLPPGEQSPLAAELRAGLSHPLPVKTARTLAYVDVMRTLLGVTRSAALLELDEAPLGRYLAALGDALQAAVLRPRLPELEQGFLRLALSSAAGTGQLSEGGIRLLNAWVDDPEREGGLAAHIASLSIHEQPMDVRLSQTFWAVLGKYPALADYAMSGQLITATDWTVRNPGIAFRREDTGEAVTTTRLARACYQACCAGRGADGIIRTLGSAGAAEIRPRQLDDVLREFQRLLHLSGALGHQETLAASEQVLFECWRLIVAGALGPDYARRFGDYLKRRLRDEAAIRTDLLTSLFQRHGDGASGTEAPHAAPIVRRIAGVVRRPGRAKRAPAAAAGGETGQPGLEQRDGHVNRA